VLRRLPILLLLVLALPSALAVGLGWWNPLAAWQQHLGLLLLHETSYLLLLSPWVREGLIGYYEVPGLLLVTAALLGSARRWEPRVPAVVLWGVDLVEGAISLAGLVAAAGLIAIACALDRPLFFAGVAVFAAAALAARSGRGGQSPASEPLRPDLLPETGDAGRLLALGLGLGSSAVMLWSLMMPWLESQQSPSLDGNALSYGWVAAALAAGTLLALSRFPHRRAGISLSFGSLALLHGLVSTFILLPEEATAGLGLRLYLIGSCGLLSAGLVEVRRPFDSGWRGPDNRLRRVLVGAFALGVLIFASTSIWEGAKYSNPVFRLSSTWVSSLGTSPWLSGGFWLLLGSLGGGLGLHLQRRRGVPLLMPAALPSRLLLAAALLLAVCGAVAQPASHLVIAGSLSALGLLVVTWCWAPLLSSPLALRRGGRWTLDPRRLLSAALPLVLWAALAMVRGLSVWMWTAPVDLPEGVEQLAGPEELGDPGCIFSLAVMPDTGEVYFTDRCKTSLGRVAADGSLQSWDLKKHLGGDADHAQAKVEELGGPVDGTLWIAVEAMTEDAQLVLLAADENGPGTVGEPGQSVPVASCWVSAWVPIPPEQPGEPTGEVLIGCEEHSMAFVFQARERQLGPSIELGAQVEEAVFHPDGTHLYSVSLWRDSVVKRWTWPYLEPAGERFVGPFNWDVVITSEPNALWVSRFLEGSALVLDPASLDVRSRVPLSFGVRAMLSEPVNALVWAAASYSGRLWAIDSKPPYERRSLALCGQTRDIAADASGRVIVATDCGLYRIDPSAWSENG